MVFKTRTAQEKAAEAAMTPREREVRGEKRHFERVAQAIHADDVLRNELSKEHRVVRLGEHPSASFSADVFDHDGARRQALVLSLPFHEDGRAITHENAAEATRGVYWSSRGDGEAFTDALDPKAGLGRMMQGREISVLGRMTDLPGRNGGPKHLFVMTHVREGVHSEQDLRARDPRHPAEFAARYVAAATPEAKDAISSEYGEMVVARKEANESIRGIIAQAEATKSAVIDGSGRTRGPDGGIDAVEMMGRGDRGR